MYQYKIKKGELTQEDGTKNVSVSWFTKHTSAEVISSQFKNNTELYWEFPGNVIIETGKETKQKRKYKLSSQLVSMWEVYGLNILPWSTHSYFVTNRVVTYIGFYKWML